MTEREILYMLKDLLCGTGYCTNNFTDDRFIDLDQLLKNINERLLYAKDQ